MRNDVEETLAAADECIGRLKVKYDEAKRNPTNARISMLEVKTAMDHLRSALDYLAVGVRKQLYPNDKNRHKIYFPYHSDPVEVDQRIQLQYPDLDKSMPQLGLLFRSVQSYVVNSDWLLVLCRQHNHAKHEGLPKQERKIRESLDIGGVFKFGGEFKNIRMWGNIVNGKRLEPNGSVNISSDMPLPEIQKQYGSTIPVTKTVDGIEFRIGETQWDALKLLETARAAIGPLASGVFSELKI